ncbi:hypothetical protein JW905_04120 [bacterium]|nr:hypothetical protein [candidate division CSSED10-310 bacterium]
MKRLIPLLLIAIAGTAQAIVIDGDFTDWTGADLKAMDTYWGMTLGADPSDPDAAPIEGGTVPAGTDATYLFNDHYDDSRDIVAFYFNDDGENVFFRIDFFDLKLYAESSGGVDAYVMVDTNPAQGETWLPDYTDCQTDMPWDLAFCVYDSVNYEVKAGVAGQPSTGEPLLGPRWHAELDSLEFGVAHSVLLDHGWDGSRVLRFQVFTCRDGTNGGAGEVPDHSDLTDAMTDDDRGFSDDTLNGSISSADRFTGRGKWAVVMHGNQPFLNERLIQSRIDKSTDPLEPIQGVGLYRAIETAELTGMPVQVHLSGTLSLGIEWADPGFNQRIADGVDAGLVELTGGFFSEHMMPFFNGAVNRRSIQLGTELIKDFYGVDNTGLPVFWIPERTARGDFYQDILAANSQFGYQYKAVILDENTHHHNWFGYDFVWDDVPGNDVQVDDNDVHKIHEYNGMKILFIDRYAQMWKTETMYPQFYGMAYEKSLQIGLRAKLIDLAMHADQAQLLLCMEDWEDYAGEPYRALASARNPDGHEIVTTWIANHQWIAMTTPNAILRNEVDITGDGNGDVWDTVTDEPITNHLPPYFGNQMPPYWLNDQLPIQSYGWLLDSADGNDPDSSHYPDFENVDNDPRNDSWDDGYQNWYWGSAWEWSFKDMVPAIRGWQYDISGTGAYPRFPLPNNLAMGALWNWNNGTETPSAQGIIPQTWNALETTSAENDLVDLAVYSYLAMLYEIAWHDEYTVRSLTEEEADDDTKGVMVHWMLPACNHVRDVNMILAAAEWADANPAAATVAEARDVDLDGEDEYLLHNDRLFLVFENNGGRLVKAYYRDGSGRPLEVVGTSIVQPDRGSEDEGLDRFTSDDSDDEINRLSCFREEGYVNDMYQVIPGSGSLTFYSSDLKIRRRVSLGAGSDFLTAQYQLDPSLTGIQVEFGLSPNTWDMMFNGKTNLQMVGGPSVDLIGMRNLAGGQAFIRYQDAEYVYADRMDRDVTIALTRRVVVSLNNEDCGLQLCFGEDTGPERPVIQWAGILANPYDGGSPGQMKVIAAVEPPDNIARVRLYYGGMQNDMLAEPMYLLDMHDDGQAGDDAAGDGVFTFAVDLAAGLPASRFAILVDAVDQQGDVSDLWPYLTVTGTTAAGSPPMTIDDVRTRMSDYLTVHGYIGEGARASSSILLGGYYQTEVTPQGGEMTLFVQIPGAAGTVNTVELGYDGLPLGIFLEPVGLDFYVVSMEFGAGIPVGRYMLTVQAYESTGGISNLWPYWEIR